MASIRVDEICKVRNAALGNAGITKGNGYSFARINRVNKKSANIQIYTQVLGTFNSTFATVMFSELWKVKIATRNAFTRRLESTSRKLKPVVMEQPVVVQQPVVEPVVQQPDVSHPFYTAYTIHMDNIDGLYVDSSFELKNSDTVVGIVSDSVVKFTGDAIVNAANEGCLGGGGIDGRINDMGGDALFYARKSLPVINGIRCPTGDAKITIAGELPCNYVIHAVGPNFNQVFNEEEGCRLLEDAYKNSLLRAEEKNLKNIAFCLLSAGIFRGGCPLKKIIEIALDTISKYTYPGLERVYLCAFTSEEKIVMLDIVQSHQRQLPHTSQIGYDIATMAAVSAIVNDKD